MSGEKSDEPRKKLRFWIGYALFVAAFVGIGIEVALRLVAPVGIMVPRYRADATYGHANWPNASIVQSKPGEYTFRLSTNERGYRGPLPSPEAVRDETVVAILGDSYSFGSGVDDGDEFAAVMREHVPPSFRVINFGVGSFALAHHIKQYHLEVREYDPDAVILQFSENDVGDNVFEPVTVPGPGPSDFTFQDLPRNDGGLKNFLSRSPIQHLQLYNHVRRLAFSVEQGSAVDETSSHAEDQQLYVDLLTRFLTLLADDGVLVVFISVEDELDDHPRVRDAVLAEHEAGRLRFVDVGAWLPGDRDYSSPEGHRWGAIAHALIGEGLAEVVPALLEERRAAPGTPDAPMAGTGR